MIASRNQAYSAAVYENVCSVAKEPERIAGKYKGLCKRAGSLVRTSGLMQTVAFMEARGHPGSEKQYHILLEHLQSELLDLKVVNQQQGPLWLAAYVRKLELPEYMALTSKILLLLNWHKRLVETFITADVEEEDHD